MDFLATVFIYHGFLSIMTIMIAGFGILFTSTFFKEKGYVHKLISVISGFLLVLAFILMILIGILNPTLFGFGYIQDDFKKIALKGNILWAEDSLLMGDGEGGSEESMYRIHAVDLDNGKELFRKPMGDMFHLIGMKGNLAWVQKENDIVGLDFLSGDEKIVLNEKSLMKYSPKLTSGIFKFELNPETLKVEVTAKDGTEVTIDPSEDSGSSQLSTGALEDDNGYQIEDDYISKNDTQLFSLTDAAKRQLADGQNHVLNNDLGFLNGRFLSYDPITQRVFILSYPTLDEKNKDFIVRCLSSQGDLLWEIKSSDLDNNYLINPYPWPGLGFVYQDQFILNDGDLVVSLNISDGKVHWQTRM